MKLLFNEVLKSPSPASPKNPIREQEPPLSCGHPNAEVGRGAGVLAGHCRARAEGPRGHVASAAEAQASSLWSQMCFCSGGLVIARVPGPTLGGWVGKGLGRAPQRGRYLTLHGCCPPSSRRTLGQHPHWGGPSTGFPARPDQRRSPFWGPPPRPEDPSLQPWGPSHP